MPIKNLIFKRFITPMDYNYNPEDCLWYYVDTEHIPVPSTKAISLDNFNIKFFNGNYNYEETNPDDEFNDYAEEVLKGITTGPGFSFVFQNQKQEEICCYFESFLLWEFDEFIQKVKSGQFAAIYVEPYSELKLMVWHISQDSLRFIIQNQCPCENFRVGTYASWDLNVEGEYKFLDTIMDVEVDKVQFIKAFEIAIAQAKSTLSVLINNYVKNNNLPEDKIHFLARKMGLEPKE